MIEWLLDIYEPYDPDALGTDRDQWWTQARPELLGVPKTKREAEHRAQWAWPALQSGDPVAFAAVALEVEHRLFGDDGPEGTEALLAGWAGLGTPATRAEVAIALGTLLKVLDQAIPEEAALFIIEEIEGTRMPAAAVWRMMEHFARHETGRVKPATFTEMNKIAERRHDTFSNDFVWKAAAVLRVLPAAWAALDDIEGYIAALQREQAPSQEPERRKIVLPVPKPEPRGIAPQAPRTAPAPQAQLPEVLPARGFKVMDRVWHAKFGVGVVTACEDDRLDVHFDVAGPKRVLDRFVEPAVAMPEAACAEAASQLTSHPTPGTEKT
jgi:hypothetical protein